MPLTPAQLSTSTIVAAALNISLLSPTSAAQEAYARYVPVRDSGSSWSGSPRNELGGVGTAQWSEVFGFDPAPQGELSGFRTTTPQEELIGEIRAWALLEENWDGEGAQVPTTASLKDAAFFINLLTHDDRLPTPMLHASGRAGLYWNEPGLYADLEFLGDGRVTYYVEKNGEDKHKGVVQVRQGKMPTVFSALLRA